MKLNRLFFFILLVLFTSAWGPIAKAMPVIVHQPVSEAKEGRPIEINAMVTDPASTIVQVKVYYRVRGSLGYRDLILQSAGFNYTGTIPGAQVTAAGVDYYLQANNQINEMATSPPLNAAAAPNYVVVREITLAPKLTLLSPDEGGKIPATDAVVVVHMDAGKSRVDLTSLRVVFDEKDISNQIEKSETMISFVAPENLAPGLHGIQVTVRNVEGMESVSPTWSFEVTAAKAPAVWKAEIKKEQEKTGMIFQGKVGIDSQFATLTKKPVLSAYLYQPEGWLNRLNLSFSGKNGDFNVIGSAFVTTEEQPGRQPVDRFRLDMITPQIALTLGDTYPVFTDFTLFNPFVRGGYLRWIMGDVNQGHSELHLVGGWNRMAVDGFTSTDPLAERAGTYERWIGGFRWLSDFIAGTGFSLNTSGIADNVASLTVDKQGNAAAYYNLAGTAEAHVKLPFSASFFSLFYGEYGLSAYYQNENYFSATLGDALRGGTRWEWGDYRSYVACEFKRTGANFVNEANPWLIGDSQGIYGDAQVNVMANNLILMGNVDIYQDNLNGQKNYTVWNDAYHNTLTVNATTATTYLSGMLSYRLPPYLSNLSLGYSVNSQKDKTEPVSMIDNKTNVLSLSAGSLIPLAADQFMLNCSYTLSTFQDVAQRTLSGNIDTSSLMASVMYLRSVWSIASGIGFNRSQTDETKLGAASFLLNRYGINKQNIDYLLFNVRTNWKVVPSKLDLGVSLETLTGKDDISKVDTQLFTAGVSTRYYFAASHSLGLTLSNIGFQDRMIDQNSYSEFVVNLSYALSF